MNPWTMESEQQNDDSLVYDNYFQNIQNYDQMSSNTYDMHTNNFELLPYSLTFQEFSQNLKLDPNMLICQKIWAKQEAKQQQIRSQPKYHETPPKTLKLSKRSKKQKISDNNTPNMSQNSINKKILSSLPINNIDEKQSEILMSDSIKSGTQNDDEMSNNGSMQKLKFKSAFKLFKLDKIAQVKQEKPEFDFRQRTQHLKNMWKDLNAEEKLEYVKRSRIEKQKAVEDQIEEEKSHSGKKLNDQK